jgi:hypothetical protein
VARIGSTSGEAHHTDVTAKYDADGLTAHQLAEWNAPTRRPEVDVGSDVGTSQRRIEPELAAPQRQANDRLCRSNDQRVLINQIDLFRAQLIELDGDRPKFQMARLGSVAAPDSNPLACIAAHCLRATTEHFMRRSECPDGSGSSIRSRPLIT